MRVTTPSTTRAVLGVALALAALVVALALTPTTIAGAGGPTAPARAPGAALGSGEVAPSAPPASPAAPIGTGDSRSDGAGPGFVGSPVVIALGVVILGVITALGTLAVLRSTGGRRG